MAEPVIRRHADHDPSLICRPALGYGLCEVLGRVAGQPEGDVSELVRVELDPAAAVEEPLW